MLCIHHCMHTKDKRFYDSTIEIEKLKFHMNLIEVSVRLVCTRSSCVCSVAICENLVLREIVHCTFSIGAKLERKCNRA